jgi:uncharacterized Zn-binding protein involved in type VI secretion
MSRGVARLDDQTMGSCSVHGGNIGGKIISASADVITNNRGVARLGDKVKADCGHEAVIITASPTKFANNRGVARLDDEVGDSPYTAHIITASPDTFD